MKTSIVPLLAAALLLVFASPVHPQVPGGAPYRSDRILVKYKAAPAATAATQAQTLRSRIGARLHRRYPALGDVEVLALDKAGLPVEAAIERLNASGAVEFAEPDFFVHTMATPNDPSFANGGLWGLRNTGQRGGANDADIDAPEAWDVRREAPNVIVAVIDTGVRYTHEDLAANMWRNPGETPGNGRDDDGNGFVDDVFGINAVNNTGNPLDDNGHGTHCAGTIGAVGDNGKGVSGVAWRVQIMACKFLAANGSGSISDAIECMNYAVAKGAHVLSNSWGGGGFSNAFNTALTSARNAGIIFVAAAGNETKDNDVSPNFPSNYPQDNVIAVGSSTRTDALSSFSNFGRLTVDIIAPGSEILSATHTSDSAYRELSGTSMATPHVAGALALLRAQFPGESHLQLINRLFNSAERLPAFTGLCLTGGRLNIDAALRNSSPAPPNDLFENAYALPGSIFAVGAISTGATKQTAAGEPNHASNAGGASIWYRWTAPGDGPATFTTDGSAFDTLLAVYTGTAINALNLVQSNDNASAGVTWSSVTFNAVEGTTYLIAVDGFNGAHGVVALSGDGPSGVANDDFADAKVLTGGSFADAGTSVDATKEPGEPAHVGNSGGRSVWWTWTPPATGPVTIRTSGSSFDTLLAVYTGNAVGALAQVAANDDFGAGLTSQVTFTATQGTPYRIAIDGYNGASGTIALEGLGTAPVLPTVTITATDANAGEGGDNGTFRLTRSGSTSSALTINLARSGTATNGTDYAPISSAVIPAGSATTTVTVSPIDDGIIEQSETVILTISPAAQYIVGSPDTATVTIADNDAALTVTIEASDSAASEGGDSGAFTLRRTGSTATELVVNLQAGGSAVAGGDYAPIVLPATIPAGQASAVLTIAPIDDAAIELAETVALTVLPGAGYIVGSPDTATVSILDNDSTVNPDNFAQRATLTGATFSTSGSTTAATKEPNEPNHAGITGGKSVWYQWTAPASGPATINTFGSNFDTLLAVYTGASFAAFVEIASNDDALGTVGVNSEVHFSAVAGTTYMIAIDGYRGASGSFVLNGSGPGTSLPIVTIDAPIPLAGESGSGSVRISRSGATGSALAVSLTIGGSAGNGTDYSAVPAVVNISAGASAVSIPITPIDDADIEGDETATFTIAANAGYQIGAPASATVTIADNDADSDNDDFANATLLTGATFHTTGSNTTATKETGEPAHAGNTGGRSVWWRWVSPASVAIGVTTNGSSFDTTLGVYTGASVNGLIEVASDDDSGEGLASQLTFLATAGTTYFIAVDGYNAASGNIGLSTFGFGPPANDNFSNRAELGEGNFLVRANNTDATREPGEPDPGVRQHSVWWKWTPAASGPVTVHTRGSKFDTVLAVHTGSSLDTLVEVARNDDFRGATSQVTFTAQARTTYHIAVGGFDGSQQGDLVLTGRINPFGPVRGAYTGLISGDGGPGGPAGSVSLKITGEGRFTGVLFFDGRRFSVRGQFDETGSAFLFVPRGSLAPLEIPLQLDVSAGSDSVQGTIFINGLEVARLVADRATFRPPGNPAPHAGRYTLLIMPPGSGVPGGVGHGTMFVTASGLGRFAGVLGDRTKVSQGVALSKDGYWPFFVPLHQNRGHVSGFVRFEEVPGESDANGILEWHNPGGARFYPAGFSVEVAAAASRFVAPTPGTPVLDFGLQQLNGLVVFGEADLSQPKAPVSITLTPLNVIQADPSARFFMKVDPRYGRITGGFADPATGKKRTFSGAVFQKLNFASGVFAGDLETGSLDLEPAAP